MPDALPGEVPDPAHPPSGLPLPSALPVRVRPLPRSRSRRWSSSTRRRPPAGSSRQVRRAALADRAANLAAPRTSNRVIAFESTWRGAPVSHFTARRAAWLLPLVAAAALVCAVAAYGVNRHDRRCADARGRQLVHDQDDGSAARIRSDRVDHRPRDLRHAVHVQGQRSRPSDPAARLVVDGEQGREDVHVPAEEERALRRRRRRSPRRTSCSRASAWSTSRATRRSCWRAITVAAKGPYTVVMHSATPATELPSILANPSLGIVNSKLAKAHGASDAANAAKTDKAENWLNSSASVGAGSGPYVLKAYSGTSQITLVPNTELLGREEAGVRQRRRAQHDRGDPADQRAARARTRSRSTSRPTRRQTLQGKSNLKVSLQPSTWVFWLFANNDPTVSAVTSNKQFQHGDPLRARLQVDPVGGRAGRDPGAGDHPVDVPRLAAAVGRDQAGPDEGEGGARGVG